MVWEAFSRYNINLLMPADRHLNAISVLVHHQAFSRVAAEGFLCLTEEV